MISQSPEIIFELLEDDGTFPNNGNLPLLIYKNAIAIPADNPAGALEHIFRAIMDGVEAGETGYILTIITTARPMKYLVSMVAASPFSWEVRMASR
jgi:hypothetical protein